MNGCERRLKLVANGSKPEPARFQIGGSGLSQVVPFVRIALSSVGDSDALFSTVHPVSSASF